MLCIGRALAATALVVLAAAGGVTTISAQAPAPWPAAWVGPTGPVHIVGPIYFIGTRGLAAYLITTPEGHILLDGGMPQNAGDFEASIRKLGFKPEDIKLLLVSHAHIDHAGTTAHFKKLSGATVAVMDRDYEHLKSGGKTDSVYGKAPPFYFPEVTAERILKDGETVSLGDIKMTARLGAGHTEGSTTWITTVRDGKRSYRVVFPCCPGANPSIGPFKGHQLVVNPSYPGIADDFRRTLNMLGTLKPDIWLGSHTESFGFEAKRKLAEKSGASAWVDPDGYRKWVAASRTAFDEAVAREKGKANAQ